MSFGDIASIINAPTESAIVHLFGPNSGPAFLKANFWQSITDNVQYRPGSMKASDIVHPVLRIAHRIIACTVFAREEPSTVSSHELLLLYYMVNPCERLPDFGAFVCHKLRQYRTRPGGAICCGGMVTLLSLHRSIPDIPTDLEIIPGETRLGHNQLVNMHMFEPGRERGTFIWKLGNQHRAYLTVTRANRDLLRLRRPISDTDWRLVPHRSDNPQFDAPFMPDNDFVFSASSNNDEMSEDAEAAPFDGPPPGVNPWVYNQLTRMEASFDQFVIEQRAHNQRYGTVVDSLWEWAQGRNPPPPPHGSS